MLNFEEYWIHPDGKSFYLWNGELSWLTTEGTKTSADSLWKFTSDGTGNGTWSEEPISYIAPSSATSQMQNLFRPGNLGCSTTIGDTGYYVGGRIWDQSDVDASPAGYFQNTITSFNMSSGVWSNDLNTSIGSVGAVVGASAGTITALGLGVGIGIGLPSLIGALWSIWLIWRTYQLKRAKKSHKMPSSESIPASEVAVPASPHPQAGPLDEHSTNIPSCKSPRD